MITLPSQDRSSIPHIDTNWRTIFALIAIVSVGLGETPGLHESLVARIAVGTILGIGLVALQVGLETLRIWAAGQIDPWNSVKYSLGYTSSVTLDESQSIQREVRGGVVGIGLDVTLFVLAVSVVMATGQQSIRHIAALGIMAIAIWRMLPIQGGDGGRLLHWYLDGLTGEDDARDLLTLIVSQVCCVLVLFTGLLYVAYPGRIAMLGVAAIAASVSAMLAAPGFMRERRWLAKAAETRIRDLPLENCPKLSVSAPIAELLHVIAVEHTNTVVIVTDEHSRPVGVISARKSRIPLWPSLWRSRMAGVQDMVISFDDIPELRSSMTVVDAVKTMERNHLEVVRVKRESGKEEIRTIRSLRRSF